MQEPTLIRSAWVNHRTGGLEKKLVKHRQRGKVNHRTGGLESIGTLLFAHSFVTHRIGGLEMQTQRIY